MKQEILSSDGLSRIEVFRREDGTFGYLESKNSGTQADPKWEPGKHCASRFESMEHAVREAEGRVAWLTREAAWPAKASAPRTALQYTEGCVECPFCGARFSLRDPHRWRGGRHLTCGQKIVVN